MNAEKKWNAIKDRATESHSDVICLQETKKEHFDDMFLRNFCPLLLTNLLFSHLMEPLVALLLHGNLLFFRANLCFRMIIPFLFSSTLFIMMQCGF